MKKRKWLLTVCTVFIVIVLCFVAFFVTAGIMSAKGYGITVGRLYFDDTFVFLIDSDDDAMIVSDQSKQKDLFEGYISGDKVVLIHGGIETSYPARTGGYYALRISKGDGTYKPEDEVIGVVSLVDEAKDDIGFEAQYIRTDGYHEDVEYPAVKIIRSVDELNTYYEANKEEYNLERKDKVYSDTTIGFLDACDKYDDAYFENQILIMVLLEEGSGSNRHKVNSLSIVDDSKWIIDIETVVPEVGTDDMAEWHILIEPEAGINVDSEADITVLLDGANPLTQPKQVQHSKGYANISLSIPDGWEYETEDHEGSADFCIAFWPEGQTEGKIKVWYYDSFGVCGTGLKEKKISVGEYEANQGTYDNKKTWDFISFIGTPGSYVVLKEDADNWWHEYGEEAMQILDSVKIADGIIDKEEAIAIAQKDVTVKYDQTRAKFDVENGLWTVGFSKKNTAGGDQVFTITHEGKIIEEAYGE